MFDYKQRPFDRKITDLEYDLAVGRIPSPALPIVCLIAITNLLSTNGEKLYLVPQGKSITGYAVKDAPSAPWELL